MIKNQNFSIYIHYPFCKAKCPYCDFNSHVRENINHDDFLKCYEAELEYFAAKIEKKSVSTIFFGGGTPSLMPIFLVEGILKKISEIWHVADDVEITLEANPTSFESAKFKDFKKAGINRLSLGIQALNDVDLKFLGREHSALEAIATIKEAAKIFDNFSFDLIYARPKQTLQEWESELKRAIGFGTKHLSLYQLTIEKGTRFFSDFQKGKFEMPDEELSAKFYELTDKITKDSGFESYEISNYAQGPNYQSKHNLAYWQGQDYIGIGAGAHGRVYFESDDLRSATMMIHEPGLWLEKVKDAGVGIQKIDKISKEELAEELIMMGLRLEDGLDENILKRHLGKGFSQIFDSEALRLLQDQGFVEIAHGFIKISQKSRLLTNVIIQKICENLLS